MGICDAVQLLAEKVRDGKPLMTPSQKLRVELLRLMPCYKDCRRLDLWEDTFQKAPDPEDEQSYDEVDWLLLSVFELGRACLYSAFDIAAVHREFAEVKVLFEHNNLSVPDPPDIYEW